MKKILKKICYALLTIFTICIGLIMFLISTTPGLYTSIKIASQFIPGKVKFKHLHGRLYDNIDFAELIYENGINKIIVNNGKIKWSLREILRGTFNLTFSANNINLENNGELEQISNIVLRGKITKEQYQISKFSAKFHKHQINLSATLMPNSPYNLSARVSITPPKNAVNQVNGWVNIKGDLKHYQWHGKFTGSTPLTIQGDLEALEKLSTSIIWHNVNWDYDTSKFIKSPTGSLTIKGTLPKLAVNLESAFDAPIKTELYAKADINGQKIRATGKISLPQENVFIRLNHTPSLTKLKITQGTNTFEVNGSAPYPWQAHLSILKPELLDPALSVLQTTIAANANITSADKGKINITISPGAINLPEIPTASSLYFNGGQIKATLNQQGLAIKGKVSIDANKALSINAKLPNFRLDESISAAQPIDGSINLVIKSVEFIEQLSADIKKAQGKLTATMSAKGSFDKPDISGNIELNQASFAVGNTGVTFAPINATLHTENKKWQLKGSVSANGRTLTMTGDGQFMPKTSGKISINGDDFPIINTEEFMANISPALNIIFAQNNVEITGKVLIPTAKIAPVNFSSSETLTEDAVFANDEKEDTSLGSKIDVQVALGQNVSLNAQGLTGQVDGSLHITQEPHSPINAVGDINVTNGRYKAYGQDLTIEQGQLTFAGGLITNPGIHVRAIRRFSNTKESFAGSDNLTDFSAANIQSFDFSDNTTVGIEVNGRLKTPVFKLFSIPASLSQADILSMLLLGKPAGQASGSGGQLLMTAISALNLGSGSGGAQLLSQINQTLGLDFSFDNNAQYNQSTNQTSDNRALTVGKKLSNRIYASYSVGLFQENSDVFTLRYLLNKFFSVQVNASDSASGIDLLYTHSK